MAYALVGPVVEVDEMGFPFFVKCLGVNSKSVILGCNVAVVAAAEPDRLIVSSMSVFELVGGSSGSKAHQLIAHTYSENGFVPVICLAYIFNRLSAKARVSGTIGNHKSVPFEAVEIVVPRHLDHFHTSGCKAVQDTVFYSAIHQHHRLFAFPIDPRLAAAGKGNLVFIVRVVPLRFFCPFRDYFAEHRT